MIRYEYIRMIHLKNIASFGDTDYKKEIKIQRC